MKIFRLIWLLLSVASRLLRVFQNWNIRRQLWRSYHNEQVAKQSKKSRQANEARRDVRRRFDQHPDQRLQDDGYRRD
jgi:hypothetical protein